VPQSSIDHSSLDHRSLDIEKLRADTPACASLVHFNNAGASLMPKPVHKTVCDHLDLETRIGGYEAHAQVATDYAAFYDEFAQLLNASPDEIAYVENATRAWDMAFYGLPLQSGDRILTHASEYVSNYLGFLQQAKRRNLFIDLIPSDEHGQIDVAAIPALITNKTRLIAITHVPTQGGLINPAVAVGKVAKAHGLMYLLDACQSVGQIDVDVKEIDCDVLTGTGRKFLRGPRGTGFMYVRTDFIKQLDPPFIDLHAARWTQDNQFELVPDAKRFENWESFIAGRLGLMHAVKYANELGIKNIETRVTTLAQTLRDQLSSSKGVQVHDMGLHKCGIVTLTKDGLSADAMAAAFRSNGVNVSVSTISSARLDFGARKLESVVRASVHYFNTTDEIDRFVSILDGM